MGIFSRLSDIINSNLNALLDKAEDPEKLVRLIIQEMEDTLVEVRSAAVRTLAEKKEIERRVAHARREQADWQAKAELALVKGRDDLAKGALHAKARAGELLAGLERQLEQIDEAVAKINQDIARLQTKLTEAKTREKSFHTRHQSATARLKVQSKLHDTRIDDALNRFGNVERKLDELEGRADVYELGKGKTLEQEIADLAVDDDIERELAQMKARLTTQAGAGQNKA